ncbi:sestrin-2 isoform X2 [Malurus melanocephalus]|uniref:sestrin-2 isoform X2 n=1 Tax=Malurus melanocephalus TaxID=175006 RepID=UPI002549A2D9|nr:sestrin-2 isoform X2 [Malurus melanocephalus]
METPKHPLPPRAWNREMGNGRHRRCPFRRRGTCSGVPQEGGESSLRQLLKDFVSAGRVDHVAMVMGLHPQYLSSFWKTQYLLLRMDGPLPYHKRHYIAIMAAARHRCSYLVGLHMGEFLQVGGNPVWLQGLHCAPPKLRNLNEINKLLAHRPWLVTKEHIEGTDAMQEVEVLMEKMKLLQENQLEEEGVTQEEMTTHFELEKTESLLVPSSDFSDPSLQSNIRCFLEDPEFGYKDFTRRGEQPPPTFHAQDYTWEDHGYSLINRLYPDVGQLLDEKFQVVFNLTYNTIAVHCGVDTSMLRRAIWNYVHCVFGIRYDDYNYGEVNQLLERNLKIYIKTVACYPEKTSKQIYTQFWRHFKHSEKVHINLLLLEARMQAALLYALRALTHYMT